MNAKKKDAVRNHAACFAGSQHEIHKNASCKNNKRFCTEKKEKATPEILYASLGHGLHSAVTGDTLAARFGLTVRELKQLILEARKQGFLICSNVYRPYNGYFIPDTELEVHQCYAYLNGGGLTRFKALEVMRRDLLAHGIDPDGEIHNNEAFISADNGGHNNAIHQ